MTDQKTDPQTVADWLTGPVWVYFVVYSFNNMYGTGVGNQFISCPREATKEDVKAFPATIVRAAPPGTQEVTVTFYTLVQAPAPDLDDLIEIAVQAAAREAALKAQASTLEEDPTASVNVDGVTAAIAEHSGLRTHMAAAVAALAAAGRLR